MVLVGVTAIFAAAAGVVGAADELAVDAAGCAVGAAQLAVNRAAVKATPPAMAFNMIRAFRVVGTTGKRVERNSAGGYRPSNVAYRLLHTVCVRVM
jgi:hypothetical protein